jgi:hypothetical protein
LSLILTYHLHMCLQQWCPTKFSLTPLLSKFERKIVYLPSKIHFWTTVRRHMWRMATGLDTVGLQHYYTKLMLTLLKINNKYKRGLRLWHNKREMAICLRDKLYRRGGHVAFSYRDEMFIWAGIVEHLPKVRKNNDRKRFIRNTQTQTL